MKHFEFITAAAKIAHDLVAMSVPCDADTGGEESIEWAASMADVYRWDQTTAETMSMRMQDAVRELVSLATGPATDKTPDIRLEDDAGTLICECSWAEFADANEDDAARVLIDLDATGVSAIGGGAAPFVRVVRIGR